MGSDDEDLPVSPWEALNKLFGQDGIKRLSTHPIFAGLLHDRAFCRMMREVADDPSALMQYHRDPRLTRVIDELIPYMVDRSVPCRAPPPVVTSADEAGQCGNEAFRKGDLATALASYELAERLDARNPRYPSNRALVLQRLGRCEDALEAALIAADIGRRYNWPNEIVGKAYVRAAHAAHALGLEQGELTAWEEASKLCNDAAVTSKFEQLRLDLAARNPVNS